MMRLIFVTSVGASLRNTDVVEARFVNLARHKRTRLLIQSLPEWI
jgi:hypothetical protein